MKKRKRIHYDFPMNRTVTDLSRPNGKGTVHIGDLSIIGVAYMNTNETDPNERFTFDLEYILWNGSDILSVLQYKSNDLYDEIEKATHQHVFWLFTQQEEIPVEEPSFFEQMADVVRKHNKILYGI